MLPSFGCLTSALACARTTRALVWPLRNEDFFALCYLGDFIGVESSKDRLEKAYEKFIYITSHFGLDLAIEKCSPPTQSLVWLGFSIDVPQ